MTRLAATLGAAVLLSACDGLIWFQSADVRTIATGYAISVDRVSGSGASDEGGYVEITLFPRSLDDDVVLTRRDTEYGSDRSVEGHAGQGLRIALWDTVVGAVAGFVAGAATAP